MLWEIPTVSEIALMLGAQTGKSQLFLNAICYYIANRPSNIMLVLPTQSDVATMKETKLDPILHTTKGVKESVAKPRGRHGKNNSAIITFNGGSVFFATAGAARTLRSRSVPILMMDEISIFPGDTGEGSPLMLARARTKTFGDRKKIIVTSTPTIADDAIHKEFLQGDQRYFHIPCEHCGHEQTIEFSHLVIPKEVDEETGDILNWFPDQAHYPCIECGTLWSDADKIRSVAKGRWIPTYPEKSYRSYQLSEMYSPLLRWSDTAKSYVTARLTYDLQSFYNTSLGLPWEEEAVKVEAHHLQQRAKDFSAQDIPVEVVMLTTGTDIQKDRIETSLIGWDKHEGSYVLEHVVFDGDTSRPDVWESVRRLF